jgi:hypothetical protein
MNRAAMRIKMAVSTAARASRKRQVPNQALQAGALFHRARAFPTWGRGILSIFNFISGKFLSRRRNSSFKPLS